MPLLRAGCKCERYMAIKMCLIVLTVVGFWSSLLQLIYRVTVTMGDFILGFPCSSVCPSDLVTLSSSPLWRQIMGKTRQGFKGTTQECSKRSDFLNFFEGDAGHFLEFKSLKADSSPILRRMKAPELEGLTDLGRFQH